MDLKHLPMGRLTEYVGFHCNFFVKCLHRLIVLYSTVFNKQQGILAKNLIEKLLISSKIDYCYMHYTFQLHLLSYVCCL